MGFAKYYEDNMDIWTDRMALKDHVFTEPTVNKEARAVPRYPSYEKQTEYGVKNSSSTRIIYTKAFTVKGNAVQITTRHTKVFWALKESIKEYGGRYNGSMCSWILPELQLNKWLSLQKQYGWLCKVG